SRTLLGKLKPPCTLPATEAREIVRRLAILSGTDVVMNDDDPYGDGDHNMVGVGEHHDPSNQNMVMESMKYQQILRELFAVGGDIESHLRGGLGPFARSCASGNAKAVEEAIKQTMEGSEERMQLLERRETGMRLSPLMIAIAISKCKQYFSHLTGAMLASMDHVKVVRVLLKYGAKPDCRELTGKTVVHYGASSRATAESLKMTEHLIEAAKSSNHFGKHVVLRKLNKAEYNGMAGRLGGFLVKTGRREVTLDEGNKKLALLPRNIFAYGEGREEVCVYDATRKLVNDFDRFGTLSLHEVFMSERTDVAQFLVDRGISVDIAPVCGNTIRKMVHTPTLFGPSTMYGIIRNYITRKECDEKNRCQGCGEIFSRKLSSCGRCKKVFYCSEQCQKSHWRAHKTECIRNEDYSIQLTAPDYPPDRLHVITSVKEVAYERPVGVGIDEDFWLKIQVASDTQPHLAYDRSRSCAFHIFPGTLGHLELLKRVQSESAFDGRKLYFKAAFDSSGNCRVYPNLTSTAKKF
ncbi:hypothetical protein ACHAWF_001714, partial [Thalassiosira exigua]